MVEVHAITSLLLWSLVGMAMLGNLGDCMQSLPLMMIKGQGGVLNGMLYSEPLLR